MVAKIKSEKTSISGKRSIKSQPGRYTKGMKNSDELHLLGLKKVQEGDIPAAIVFFQKALCCSPEDPVIYNNLGTAYQQLKQDKAAIKAFEQALRLDGDYAEALNNLALLYQKQGFFQKALEHYSRALKTAPDFTQVHFNLGLLLLRLQKLKPALTQFKNVLALDESNTQAAFYAGVIALESDCLKEAETYFQSVITAEPYHSYALNNLGVIALKKQDSQTAISWFTQALAVDIKNTEARNNLAATFIHHDRFENALTHYAVLIEEDPDNTEYRYNAGVAEMMLGHLDKAMHHLNVLLKNSPRHFAALTNLAAIYNRKGDKDKAADLLQQAMLIKPQDKAGRHMLSALNEEGKQAETCEEYALNLFNNYALYYDKHIKEVLHYSLPSEIRKLLERYPIKQLSFSLDLGCGTGIIGEVIRPFTKVLTGVDLAPKMLKEARKKGLYDVLVENDLLTFFKQDERRYDCILAADVFPYYGALDDIFEQVASHLLDTGIFIFTTEISETSAWALQSTARFSHHLDYLKELASKNHLSMIHEEKIIGRKQDKKGLFLYLIMVSRQTPGQKNQID